MAVFRPLILPLLLLSLGGCKLIDQTTFFAPDPEPEAVAAATTPPPVAPPSRHGPALVSIRYDRPNPAYQEPLATAMRAAQQRRPNATYDVIAVSNVQDAGQAARDAGAVMSEMVKLGVPAARIHLGAELLASQAVREVRVHLR